MLANAVLFLCVGEQIHAPEKVLGSASPATHQKVGAGK